MDDPSARPLLTLVQAWHVEERELLLENKLFKVRSRFAQSLTSANKRGTFFYMDSLDWVNVIALTPERQVVCIEQYRVGSNEVTLEIPGGMCDAGEAPLDASIRELREETGYAGTRAEIIGSVTPNPAIQNNRCHTALVQDARLLHAVAFDDNEEIGVRLLPLEHIDALILSGVIHHALVLAAFMQLKVHLAGGGTE
ncbi:MAG: NUDIX hydrolase [Pseudomonadota bacterium]